MDDNENTPNNKVLESEKNSALSGLIVPVGIVLLACVIILGVTKMVSSDRTYHDLISELESRQFGNKWISAYELSKLLATSRIPEDEMREVIERLSHLYKKNPDAQTRHFLIVALGSLKNQQVVEVLVAGLNDDDAKVQFSAMSAIGNLPLGLNIDWEVVSTFLQSDDKALKHAAILTLARHQVSTAEKGIEENLSGTSATIRYAAATALIFYKNPKALATLKEIMLLPVPPKKVSSGFNQVQVESLKLNVLNALQTQKWSALNSFLKSMAPKLKGQRVAIKAQELLNLLNN